MTEPGRVGLGRVGLAAIGVSVAGMVGVGLLGPSVVQPPLGAVTALPPYSLNTRPAAWPVAIAVGMALLLGALGVLLGWLALRRGWAPDPRRLLVAGAVAVVALVLVPPMGSADHLSYAAYGRIAAAGDNPYVEAPQTWRDGTDPVTRQVERPWRWAPSVYGPLATAEQAGASLVAGASLRATVWLLALVNGAAFLGAGLLLHRLCRGSPVRQVRAALLWTCNPLLLYEAVAGMHVDTLAAVAGVGAIAVAGSRGGRSRAAALAAGLLVGVGLSIKLPAALVGVALVWALRRDAVRAGAVLLGAAAVSGPAYLLAGPHVFDQLRRAATYVSLATPWRLVLDDLTRSFGHDEARLVIGRLALLLALLLLVALARLAPRPAEQSVPEEAARAAFLLVAAWVMAAPYTLPWYDVLAWAPLALLPASGLDLVVLARTTLLALCYVPGRVTDVPAALSRFGMDVRAQLAPRLLLALTAGLVLAALAVQGRRLALPRRARVP